MARNIYHISGAPTLRNLKMMIRQKIIHNYPFTFEYIEISEKIFGTDVYTLKGRTIRRRPIVVVDDFIEIPRELIEKNQELMLWMEIMFINKQALFKTIEKYIRFQGLSALANMTKEEWYRALGVVMRHYNKSGFAVKHIGCDDEFKSIMD